jgi:hypothetical protein
MAPTPEVSLRARRQCFDELDDARMKGIVDP